MTTFFLILRNSIGQWGESLKNLRKGKVIIVTLLHYYFTLIMVVVVIKDLRTGRRKINQML